MGAPNVERSIHGGYLIYGVASRFKAFLPNPPRRTPWCAVWDGTGKEPARTVVYGRTLGQVAAAVAAIPEEGNDGKRTD